jgi:ABC-type glycerol-3-phosphate transport system substrate-binding protein
MTRTWRVLAVAAAFTMVAAACGGTSGSGAPPSSAGAGTTISVTSLWGGAEEAAFLKVLDAFKAKTGININYIAQRTDYATVLRTKIAGGQAPDIAIIPGIGFLRSFARDGSITKLKDLGLDPSAVAGNYPPGMFESGQVDGEQYAVIVKFNSKSTFFYRPDKFTELGVSKPATLAELKTLVEAIKSKGETPLGLGAKDSWTLTDWFESIYLRQAGGDAYAKLFSKDGNWEDQTVKDAITTMTDILAEGNVVGGIKGSLGVGFVDGIGQVFKASPQAAMYYEGGFVYGIATKDVNKDLKLGETIDWFEFPSDTGSKDVTIGGDVIAAFSKNPGVKEFIEYMTTADSGTVWGKEGTIISPIKGVDVAATYPNESVKREAQQVFGAAKVFYDGSDLLPAGPDLGAVLQGALKGDAVDGLLKDFQAKVTQGWADE